MELKRELLDQSNYDLKLTLRHCSNCPSLPLIKYLGISIMSYYISRQEKLYGMLSTPSQTKPNTPAI